MAWVALSGGFAFTLAGASPARASTSSGANGKIIFVRSGAIFSVTADESALKQLTTPGPSAVDTAPRASPDGPLIVFERDTSNPSADNIWIMNADPRTAPGSIS